MINFKIEETLYKVDINDTNYEPDNAVEDIILYITDNISTKKQETILTEISSNEIFNELDYTLLLNDNRYQIKFIDMTYNHRLILLEKLNNDFKEKEYIFV